MAEKKYVFSREAALCTKEEKGIGCMSCAIQCAVAAGYGFVIEINNRVKTIYAWDFEVVSYDEACQRFGYDSEKMLAILGAKKTGVFIVAKAGGTDTVLFPFRPFRRLMKINPADYGCTHN